MRFTDTNVLLYAAIDTPENAGKHRIASEILSRSDLCLSVQVLQEFYYQATRPTRLGRLTYDDALAFLGTLLRFPVQDVTLGLFREATVISRRYHLSYWDGAILAAARALGCEAVYSEDLSAQQDYDGLRVINPFREEAEAR